MNSLKPIDRAHDEVNWKVQQAEWKLAGLCELCGAPPLDGNESIPMITYMNHPDSTLCLHVNKPYANIDKLCLDKILWEFKSDG